MPTTQKYYKKQYEINIFLLHDQNMTKNNPHAQDAYQDKGLTKNSKNDKQKHIFKDCSQRKNAVKNKIINIFVLNDQKMHSCAKF